jgi:signal peptidase I
MRQSLTILVALLSFSSLAHGQAASLDRCFTVRSGAMLPAFGSGQIACLFSYQSAADAVPGDLVVFVLPKDNSIGLKRLIGLPGDRVQMIRGALHLNGQPVARVRVEDFETQMGNEKVRVKRWRETLPNGQSYETLDFVENGFFDDTPIYVVPSGASFVMADNRDNGTDSRALSLVGYIPLRNILGRAVRR